MNKKLWQYFIALLLLVCLAMWLAALSFRGNNLIITACDVGQGDAFLIGKGKTQVLVDGGPNDRVIDCLNNNVPFWDRTIELVILTHPQADHYTGLIDVFNGYDVQFFLANSVNNDTQGYRVLKELIASKGVKVLNPDKTQDFKFANVGVDIIYPFSDKHSVDSSVLGTWDTTEDLNDFSVMFYLTYNNFSALFTGDISPSIEGKLLDAGVIHKADYLKVPHHGSKNGLTKTFLDAVSPKIAVIGVGSNNRFGHPHPEVLELLSGVEVHRTDLQGEISVETDGEKWWVR